MGFIAVGIALIVSIAGAWKLTVDME